MLQEQLLVLVLVLAEKSWALVSTSLVVEFGASVNSLVVARKRMYLLWPPTYPPILPL